MGSVYIRGFMWLVSSIGLSEFFGFFKDEPAVQSVVKQTTMGEKIMWSVIAVISLLILFFLIWWVWKTFLSKRKGIKG